MKSELSLYDTKAREVLAIEADENKLIRIYCCGPTVYRDAHVGNLRTFLLMDFIVRALRFQGYSTSVIQNITDVGHMSEDFESEDKMLAEAQRVHRSALDIAREYEAKFHADLAALNALPADVYPRASESIEMMQDLIAKLIDQGNAYVGDDNSVYFSAESFESYGAISGNRLTELKPGHRYEYTEGGAKRFHADWALWKSAGNRSEMVWDSPWGKGFPGWHIECSAMSMHFLDSRVDLHLGGIDLRFPHHEDERAQSNSAADGREVVTSWVHGEHLLFEGRKMSKSAGNVVLLSDVIAKGLDPLSLRLSLLENRYRSQMDLSWDSLKAADATLKRWREKIREWSKDGEPDSSAIDAQSLAIIEDINTDLDTPRAIQKLRSLEKSSEISGATKAAIFAAVDPLFGLDFARTESEQLPPGAQELLDARARARADKDYAESDRLRDQLTAMGVKIKDGTSA
jgi:cysteinyl-tRNA synthetase